MPNEIPDNEPELLLRISQGDARAFRQLFAAYSGKVYALAIKLTKDAEQAKDLTQEIFVRLWVKRGQLGGVYHFQGFLTTIALNLIRNHFRRKVLDIGNEAFLVNYFEESAMAPDRAMEFKEFQCMVQEAVDHLPPQLNRSFTLSRMAGMSHAEIARQMELSPLTVKSHIARALTFIRAYLEQHSARAFTLLCAVVFKKFF
ncbi:MAG TPA: sigma-70 family RNA polymerase sigma factor [Puia sp.]|nr:sigma-70 family RNA polymerase sigma factor [Puia sp.]